MLAPCVFGLVNFFDDIVETELCAGCFGDVKHPNLILEEKKVKKKGEHDKNTS